MAEEKDQLYAEDIVSKAIYSSTELMLQIQQACNNAQDISISVSKYFKAKREIRTLRHKHRELSRKFQKTYIIDPSENINFPDGNLTLNPNKSVYSYLLSSLVAAMRQNIKDTKVVNESLVLLGLMAQQGSYENMLYRLQSSLNDLSTTLNDKTQELNNLTAAALNMLMVILTTVAVIAALESLSLTTHDTTVSNMLV